MAANTLAMEAMTLLAASRVDRDKNADVRLEAALCKLWATENAWQIVNDTMQIRGGRGYETAASLKARDEPPIPVERFLRDSRINTIFEGSSEIMRLFVAREMLDPHLKVAAPVLNSQLPGWKRLRAALNAVRFYARWYPRQYFPVEWFTVGNSQPGFPAKHLRYAARTGRKLARTIFHALLRHGPKLEREQLLLGRFVDIGAELFAITATCSHVQQLLREADHPDDRAPLLKLLDCFCRAAQRRIHRKFHELHHNDDHSSYHCAQQVMAGQPACLANGIVRPHT
jgi:hypothetical protein